VNAHRCCDAAGSDSRCHGLKSPSEGVPRSFAHRCFDVASWIIPGAILMLMPKCPMCLAAYVAIGTGVGISLSTVMHLRTALLLLSLALLLCLVVRRWCAFTVIKDALRRRAFLAVMQTKEKTYETA
jgi:hypothetical protein